MGDRNYLEQHLPNDLKYLIAPAMKYGCHQFDEEIDAFLDRATDAEMNELAALAERVRLNSDYPRILEWYKAHNKGINREAPANVYFLFGVMDAADLEFD